MDSDPFRYVALAIFCVTVAVAGYHRWQASRSGERISRRGEGLVLAVTLRLAGAVLWLSCMAYLVNPDWLDWSSMPLPDWLRWTGAAIGAVSIGFTYWTLTNLGKNLTDTVATRLAATLVTSGPYRWVRHPFYISVTGLILAVTLISANWFIGLCGAVVMTLLYVRTTTEEAKLVEKFGDGYRNYMTTTGRFWPKL